MTEHVTGTGNKAELTAPLTPDKLIQDLCEWTQQGGTCLADKDRLGRATTGPSSH